MHDRLIAFADAHSPSCPVRLPVYFSLCNQIADSILALLKILKCPIIVRIIEIEAINLLTESVFISSLLGNSFC